ncbi:extracellular solute-binding protein [Aquabacterium sp.]|uniref:extracellular solute-binding protein n=1 Tax=Aquabacterium sp. TaxID=1872578 RepID=UPI0037851AE8
MSIPAVTAPAGAAVRQWRLQHRWQGAVDRAALAGCREALAAHGIALVDADEASADAVKMHGAVLADTAVRQAPALLDLSALARADAWADRLPRWLCAFASHAGAWYGVPMGVHRSNVVWLAPRDAAALGPQPLRDAEDLLAVLARARPRLPKPLAVGREPWQIGALFETLLLAQAGPEVYRHALVALSPAALRSAAFVRTLQLLTALREFADDAALHLPWDAQRARVARGEAALQVMGDWSAALPGPALQARPAGAGFIAVADFIVPLARGDAPTARAAAAVLAQDAHQQRYGALKSCRPAFGAAGADAAAGAGSEPWLPSLALEQCHPAQLTHALLQVLADHFLQRRSGPATATVLADLAATRA